MGSYEDMSAGYRVTIVGAVVNILLSAIKGFAGITGNSAAMVADAVHSISDLATDVVVYFSLKISDQGPDAKHPYGHGRAETIGSAFVGGAVFLVGLGIAWEVFTKVVGGKLDVPASIALWGAAISIVGKELLYQYTYHIGKKLRSDSIKANAWHHRTDAISSVAALIGIAAAKMGYPLMDPLAAILVGLMIMHVGGKITWEAVQNLMDTGLPPEELEEIKEIIENTPGVLHFHELKTRKVGRDSFVDLHVQVNPRISTSEAHNIAESVRQQLTEKVSHVHDALVHIDAEDDRGKTIYDINRREVEAIVKRAMDESDIIQRAGDVILHLFFDRTCVEIPVKGRGNPSTEAVSDEAKKLAEKLLASGIITEVDIRLHLGTWKKATE